MATRVAPGCNLTNGQLVLWAGQQLAGDVACYDNATTFVVERRLDPDRFAAAFQSVVDRSDALRTVVETVDGVPVQRVLPELAHRTPVVRLDAEDLPAWAAERAARPSRLDERLFDSVLVDLGPDRTAWYLNLHHLLHDGWSCLLVYRETAEAYARGPAGRPPLPSFADHVAREAAARDTEAWRRADAHWRAVLEREHEPLEPYGVSRARRTTGERWVTLDLGPERTRRLRDLAATDGFRSLSADLSVLGMWCAILAAYLYRVSGTRELSIGLPFHNRDRATRATIGLVQQVYPLRLEVGDGETMASLTAEALRGLWEVIANSPPGTGNAGDPAVTDVMLNYLPISFPPFDGAPTTTRFVPRSANDGRHTFGVQVHDLDGSGSAAVDLTFNAGVFDERLRAAAAGHFLNVVDAFVADPGVAVDDVDLLTEAERHHVLVELNDTARDWSADRTVDRLVAEQAARTPDAVAAVHGAASLTYAQLDERANRLAHHLRSLGVGRGVIVAVYAERSLDLVAAVLAIFKAGGAYLPLDTTYPGERLAFILDDARAAVLVTQTDMCHLDAATADAVVHLDAMDDVLAAQPATPPPNPAGPDDLAYVIYTSGSTGRPKGAAVPQRALVNVVLWQVREASTLERPRTLQFSPLSFDVSMQELFATWAAGGTLVLPEGDVRRDPEALLRLLVDQRVEQLYAIFTPLQQLADAVDRLDLAPSHLREVFTAGEAVTITPTVQRFFERLPGCRFQNQYGSSEDLIITSYTLEGPPATWPRRPPIGRPIANAAVYLVDTRLRPVPVGVPGEICIGGAQVALGYLHRPELTAERFVPCPFVPQPGARMFRQGDLARHLPGGDLQFLGRNDHQVKLRGYRIEPGEVEAALREHPLVADAVVVAREDEPGKKRLVAYLAPGPGWSPSHLPELRDRLAGRLAPYMVPAAFVVLDALPTTPSGKLDRTALPAPDPGRPELGDEYVAPTGELEEALAGLWAEALGVDRVGVHDDFFRLGGDSLLAVRVMHRTEDLVGRRLPLVTLFEAPTVARLAPLLRDATAGGERASLVPIRTQGTKAPLHLVAGLNVRHLVDRLDPDRPLYALQPRGLAGYEPDTRIEDMAAHYVDEVRAVQPRGPYLVAGVCLGGQIAFEMARQLVAAGEEVAATVVVESFAPGVLGFLPPTRRGRLRRRVKRLTTELETVPGASALVAAWTRARYGRQRRSGPGRDGVALSTIKRVQRSNLRAALAYAPPPYPGRLTLLRGDRSDGDDPTLGWGRFATGGVDTERITGFHGTVLQPPHVDTLAERLAEVLDRTGR
jgi:amino acid adenylation domain-containing protein